MARGPALAGALAAALVIGCGGSGQFRLTSNDNDPARLAAAFARLAPPRTGPVNQTGRPLAFLVARGVPKKLIAFDLDARRELWRVDADVASRVVVGRAFVASLERGGRLVGRDLASGRVLWTRDLAGARFLGAAADPVRVFFTAEEKRGKSTWVLRALDGQSGEEKWRADSPGALGTPAARGGLVFSPFLKQWLAILDAETGEQLTRIRGIDEEITTVRADSDNVFFGSRSGLFLLDRRAASGRRAQSTYGAAALPRELARAHYDWDALNPVQSDYSAYDRNRILWRARPEGGALRFAGDRVVVHTYRFFGLDARTGALTWAYSYPRVDVVGSAHLGPVIAYAAMMGGLGALDPATGRRVYAAPLPDQILGVTFDAEGWTPSDARAGEAQPGTAAVLAAIANDRDARFDEVKRYAVAALATLGGPGVVADLVALLDSESTPPALHDAALAALLAHVDSASLPALAAALEVRADYASGRKARAVGAVARAIALLGEGKGKGEIAAAERARAVRALVGHLAAPDTELADLGAVMRALDAIGGGAEVAPLGSFLLLHRTDPAFAVQVGPLGTAIDILLRGGTRGREVVTFVADDPRTQKGVAEYAARALRQSATATAADGGGAAGR